MEPTRIYRFDDAKVILAASGIESESLAREVDGCVMGAFVRATKPAAKSSACCGPDCCGASHAA
jgi:hypothetical protein